MHFKRTGESKEKKFENILKWMKTKTQHIKNVWIQLKQC